MHAGLPASAAPASASAPRASVIDTALRLILLATLVGGCLWIAEPFLVILLWSSVLAVMLWPMHCWLRARRGFNNARAATLVGIGGAALLAVPLTLIIGAIARSVMSVADAWRAGTLALPPAPAWLAQLPAIGTRATAVWEGARGDLGKLAVEHGDAIRAATAKLAAFVGSGILGLLAAIAATAVAAILLAWGHESAGLMRAVFVRVSGNTAHGDRLLALSTSTIRGVLRGVVGVAFVQALLVGLGFLFAGVPYAGVLTLVVLLFGIVQFPPVVITLPVLVWAWNSLDSTTAAIFTAWTLFASLSDNVLKPIMLGRGLDVPMPVILIGVIGSMLAEGLLGLFVGPVILAVGYVLFQDWLAAGTDTGA